MTTLSSDLVAELDASIAKHQLEAVADEIRKNACECYAMVAVGEDDYSTIGNTRFGGDPDMPEDMDWPTDPNESQPRYSNFIAQINFAELTPLSMDYGPPQNGILYLFVRYMYSAARPVLLDALFYGGDIAALSRRFAPENASLCDEYLVDLVPQRIKAIPSVSIASFRKRFREYIEQNADERGDRNDLEYDLHRKGQIGQILGFANAADERENLYRQVVLARLGKRDLIYDDSWDSMDEYEAYIESWRDDKQLVEIYRGMRDGVMWLTSNREMISRAVDEWRLLFRLDSNFAMNLNINDADPLYVFIRDQDLARRDFSNLAGEVTQG